MDLLGRAPHGARGLKWKPKETKKTKAGRAPHGARGLKYLLPSHSPNSSRVAPRMGRVD